MEVLVLGLVVLAAGGSSRMGRPKALLPVQGRTLLAAHLKAYRGHVREMVVVGGAEMERLRPICEAEGAKLIENSEWQSTMPIDSLRLGVTGMTVRRCVVTPVDTVPISESDLRALTALPGKAVLAFQGMPGHPVLLGDTEIDRLQSGDPLEDLRFLMSGAIPVASNRASITMNLNRPKDWDAWVNSGFL